MSTITICVVITHFNQRQFLDTCIRSLAAQVRLPDEIIIVDDCSSNPPSYSELADLVNAPLLLISSRENSGGPAFPRNLGIAASTSSHAVFLDCDDILMPYTLKVMELVWENNPYAIAYGDQISWDPLHNKLSLQYARRFNRLNKLNINYTYQEFLACGNQIFLSGTGGPVQIFLLNTFDELQRWEDYDLWLRLACFGYAFEHTNYTHSLYRLSQASRSGTRAARHQGCKDIKRKYFAQDPPWKWPFWYWRQRFI